MMTKAHSTLWNGWPEDADVLHQADRCASLALAIVAVTILLGLTGLGLWWLFGARGLWIGAAWLVMAVLVAALFGALVRGANQDFSSTPSVKGDRRSA